MKVYIGPYKNWVGPYQLAELLEYIGISKDKHHKIGEWLANTWVNNFCEWVHSKQKRKIKIHVDGYDAWNADNTLGMVILPVLKRLKKDSQGSPHVELEDVPENLRINTNYEFSMNGFLIEYTEEEKTEMWNLHAKRWEYVLDEIIWAFEQINDENWEEQYIKQQGEIDWTDKSGLMKWTTPHIVDWDGRQKHQDRINNGLRLFGKYYQGLWN